MKYEHLMTDTDKWDLVNAASLVADGRALRKKVLARLRARAFRLEQSAKVQTGFQTRPKAEVNQ